MGKKLFMIAIGVFMLFLFGSLLFTGLRQKERYNKCDSETVGTLTRTERYSATEGSKKHRRTVTRYRGYYDVTIGGVTYNVNGSNSGYSSEYSVPDIVSVVYQESNPSECFIKGDNGTGSLAMAIGGGIFAIIWIGGVIITPASQIRVNVGSSRRRRH